MVYRLDYSWFISANLLTQQRNWHNNHQIINSPPSRIGRIVSDDPQQAGLTEPPQPVEIMTSDDDNDDNYFNDGNDKV